eukprot:jgi/Psemu1/290176/fgenesh1_pg.460_\
MSTPNPKDPSGFLNLDSFGRPSQSSQGETVVKIVATARDDLNGLLGFCTSYSEERQRYMVRMASVDTDTNTANATANATHATVMALKPSNLARASTLESYRAKFQQLQTNPILRRKLTEYYAIARAKCRPVAPEHAAGAGLVLLFGMIYLLGFTKTLMLGACAILLGALLVEDVIHHRKPWREVLQRLPSKCNAMLCEQAPMLRGKLSDAVAAGLIGLIVAFTIQSVFFTGGSKRAAAAAAMPPASSRVLSAPSARTTVHREVLEEFYNLGFQDSLDGRDRGHSFAGEVEQFLQATTTTTTTESDLLGSGNDDLPLPPLTPPPPPRKTFVQRLVSVKTAGSVFYLYRVAMQVGIDQSTGIFSFGQLFANIQHQMPPWQKGMLAFSCYNLLSNLFF